MHCEIHLKLTVLLNFHRQFGTPQLPYYVVVSQAGASLL